jgi:hypothetical protein
MPSAEWGRRSANRQRPSAADHRQFVTRSIPKAIRDRASGRRIGGRHAASSGAFPNAVSRSVPIEFGGGSERSPVCEIVHPFVSGAHFCEQTPLVEV